MNNKSVSVQDAFWTKAFYALKKKKLTIPHLAKMVGVSNTALRVCFFKHSSMNFVAVCKIAKILDISLDELKKNVEIDKQSDGLIKPHKMHVTKPEKGSTEFLNIVYELESKYGSIGAIPLNDERLHKAWKLIDPNKNINETVQKWSKLTVKTRNRRY